MPRHDEHTRDRAGRLSELRKEALVAFGCGDPPSTAEQHLVECWATLKLGFEVLSARLVGGAAVDAVELIKLNEALAAYMPPRKQHQVDRVEIVFVDTPEREADLRSENELLKKGIAELRAALAKATGQDAEPERTLTAPDRDIQSPRKLPAPSRADAESAAAWAATLGHQPRPPSACWTERNGYYDPENR
jgi:hypothetical protein